MKQCRECPSYAINIDIDSGLCDVCYYREKLLDLLAIVHRDGGPYTAGHGIEKSVKDAKKIVSDLVVK